MAVLSTRFLREIQQSLGRHIPWTPNLSVTLGDVGVLVDGVFEHRTTLATLGVDFRTTSKEGETIIDFASRGGVEVEIATGDRRRGETSIGARARVTFSRSGDGLLQAIDVDIAIIDDPASVAAAIVARVAAGTWEREWVFVSEVHTAAATTVMVSQGRNAVLEMDAVGAIGAQAPLASGFVVSRRSGGVMKWVGARGLTPLFALSRVKPTIIDDLFGTATGRSGPMKLPPWTMLHDPRTLLEEVPLGPLRRRSSAPPPKRKAKRC